MTRRRCSTPTMCAAAARRRRRVSAIPQFTTALTPLPPSPRAADHGQDPVGAAQAAEGLVRRRADDALRADRGALAREGGARGHRRPAVPDAAAAGEAADEPGEGAREPLDHRADARGGRGRPAQGARGVQGDVRRGVGAAAEGGEAPGRARPAGGDAAAGRGVQRADALGDRGDAARHVQGGGGDHAARGREGAAGCLDRRDQREAEAESGAARAVRGAAARAAAGDGGGGEHAEGGVGRDGGDPLREEAAALAVEDGADRDGPPRRGAQGDRGGDPQAARAGARDRAGADGDQEGHPQGGGGERVQDRHRQPPRRRGGRRRPADRGRARARGLRPGAPPAPFTPAPLTPGHSSPPHLPLLTPSPRLRRSDW